MSWGFLSTDGYGDRDGLGTPPASRHDLNGIVLDETEETMTVQLFGSPGPKTSSGRWAARMRSVHSCNLLESAA